MEEQKVISAPRRTRWPDLVKLGCVLVRVTVGGLFVFAGATKAYDPGAFAIEIQRYQLVPWILAALISVYLPWLEMLSGALLLLKRFERGALLLTTLFCSFFTAANIAFEPRNASSRLKMTAGSGDGAALSIVNLRYPEGESPAI